MLMDWRSFTFVNRFAVGVLAPTWASEHEIRASVTVADRLTSGWHLGQTPFASILSKFSPPRFEARAPSGKHTLTLRLLGSFTWGRLCTPDCLDSAIATTFRKALMKPINFVSSAMFVIAAVILAVLASHLPVPAAARPFVRLADRVWRKLEDGRATGPIAIAVHPQSAPITSAVTQQFTVGSLTKPSRPP